MSDPRKEYEESFSKKTQKEDIFYALFVPPCFYSVHGENREGGYVAVDNYSGGCLWVCGRAIHGAKFFESAQACVDLVKRNPKFFISRYEIHCFVAKVYK